MQVDKQPSPWPAVAMLIGLLLFCLAAPRYWEDDSASSTTGYAEHAAGVDGTSYGAAADFGPGIALPEPAYNFGPTNWGLLVGPPNGDLLNLWSPPNIDELIRSRVGTGQLNSIPGMDGGSYDWPLLQHPGNGAFENEPGEIHPDAFPSPPGPLANAAFEFAGALVAQYSSASALTGLTTQIAEVVPELFAAWSQSGIHANLSARSSLRLVGPGDRLAMLPARPRSGSWCVPEVLFDQLHRLSGHPYSAQWASHVSNQLHALTERDQLEGDDVQAILADLSDSAEEALRMADSTEEDRLRVELLRTHWGLARRLDCWGAMHEQRVATHFRGRVAARGELSPYFDSTPDQPAVPTDVTALSNDIETYEQTRDPLLGRQVVEQQRALAASPASFDRALADAMEQHYRNANVRIAVTAELLNKMLGDARTETRPVHEQIAGASVFGRSNIRSESRVLLDPSDDEWVVELKSKGVVESNTLADGGPVRFRSRGTTDFSAQKSVVLDQNGFRLQPSKVDARCSNRLVGVTTDYDWVPIFGGYARDRALQEYHARQNRTKSQIEFRVSSEARDTLDQQTSDAVDKARKQLYDRFTSRADKFGIQVTPVEIKTASERVVARVRVASDKQLGSHTPRPRALSDSLASLQIHETTLTNLAVTLGLDGQRFTGPELQKKLRETFSQLASKDPIEPRHDTVFQFAKENCVQFHFNEGKLELTIAFDSVELEGQAMRDVVVHASYVPAIDGLNAELIRDGALGIEGQFRSAERARLHNVFNRVLPPERHITLVRIDNPEDRRFQGLMITQLVLEDGWVGLAVGPSDDQRVAERTRSLR